MNSISIGILFLISGVSTALAGVTVKDWSYEKVVTTSGQSCQVYTESENPQGYRGTLKVNFPFGTRVELPSIEIQLSGFQLEQNSIKGAVGASNRTSLPSQLIGLRPNLSRQDFYLPAWDAETLLADLVADRTFTVDFLNFDGNVVTQMDFSLFGSTAVVQELAADCLGKSSVSSPHLMSKYLFSEQKELSKSVSESSAASVVSGLNQPDEYYSKSETFYDEIQKLGIKKSEHQVAVGDLTKARSSLDRSNLKKQELTDEKSSLISEKETLSSEEPLLASRLERQNQELDIQEGLLRQVNIDLRQSREKLRVLKTAHENQTLQVQKIDGEVRQERRQLATVSDELNTTASHLVNKRAKLRRTRNEIQTIGSSREKARKQNLLQSKRQELSDKELELRNFNVEARVRRRVRRESPDLDRRLENARRNQQQAQNLMRQTSQRVNLLEERKRNLERRVGGRGPSPRDRQEIQRLKSEDQRKSNQMASLRRRLGQENAQVQRLQQDLQRCEARTPRRDGRRGDGRRGDGRRGDRPGRGNCESSLRQLSQARNKVAQTNREIQKVRSEKQTIDRQIQSLEGRGGRDPQAERDLRQVNTNLRQARQDLARHRQSQQNAQQRLSSLQIQRNNLAQSIRRDVRQRQIKLSNNVQQLRTDVRRLVDDINASARKTDHLRRDARQLAVEVQDLESKESALLSRKSTSENTIRNLRSRRSAITESQSYKTRIQNIRLKEREESQLVQRQVDRQGHVNEARQAIARIQRQINTTPGRLSNIDDRLITIEADFDSVEELIYAQNSEITVLQEKELQKGSFLDRAIDSVAGLSKGLQRSIATLLF